MYLLTRMGFCRVCFSALPIFGNFISIMFQNAGSLLILPFLFCARGVTCSMYVCVCERACAAQTQSLLCTLLEVWVSPVHYCVCQAGCPVGFPACLRPAGLQVCAAGRLSRGSEETSFRPHSHKHLPSPINQHLEQLGFIPYVGPGPY